MRGQTGAALSENSCLPPDSGRIGSAVTKTAKDLFDCGSGLLAEWNIGARRNVIVSTPRELGPHHVRLKLGFLNFLFDIWAVVAYINCTASAGSVLINYGAISD